MYNYFCCTMCFITEWIFNLNLFSTILYKYCDNATKYIVHGIKIHKVCCWYLYICMQISIENCIKLHSTSWVFISLQQSWGEVYWFQRVVLSWLEISCLKTHNHHFLYEWMIVFQLYHGVNKLIFNEMIMRFALH